MTSEPSLIERQMADVELRSFTVDEFHRRRHRKQRNRRIATTAMGLVLMGAAVGGAVLQSLGEDDERVESEVLGPLPSPFAGTWESTDEDGSSQTMEIDRTDRDEHEIVLHDDAATSACGGAAATLTGSGRVRSVDTLVIAAQLTCDDGSTPTPMADPESARELQETLANLTFTHDPQTDELLDSLGVRWWREGTVPEAPMDDAGSVIEGPSPFQGSWVASGVGEVSPESMEITWVADGDLHEVVIRNDSALQCSGGATTLTATGRRQAYAGLVQLALSSALACDDGSTPIPASPEEEGMLDNFPLTLVHDPVTDEVVGSLGVLWWREGTERKQGDPMATVERMIDAVTAGDADAFIALFAPDGGFDPRGSFETSAMSDSQPISESSVVRAWMAIQDAWGFEADMSGCTSDPSEAPTVGKLGDLLVECEVAARWPKLSLAITERWRFELRGARLLHWEPVPRDLDPSGRDLPLGYPGLEDWEAWLEENRAEDAARWLNPFEQSWAIDGHQFSPDDQIPYDPAFADEIEASIDEYLAER